MLYWWLPRPCDFKTKRLSSQELDGLADTPDESGARRMYLAVELARNKDDASAQQNLVSQMEQRFPASPWLAEALYTSAQHVSAAQGLSPGDCVLQRTGYALSQPPPRAEQPLEGGVAELSPGKLQRRGAAVRQADCAFFRGARRFRQRSTGAGACMPTREHAPAMAAAYYQTVARAFEHYYYAQLARDRLTELGQVTPADVAMLTNIHPEEIPALTDDVPEDDEHVIKARLLANAGLNEYIPVEIQAADGSEQWGAFAEAHIYASDGETFRAMRVLKRALPFYTSAPLDTIPMGCWKILFPQPYWSAIEQEAAKNGLDPYMVASLIRQESEFNPGAVSSANAFGLMQLLPSVGRSMAKQEGIHHFNDGELFNPETNIRLGTRYLKQTLGQV